MKNVIKPTEAVLLDEEVVIGSHDSKNEPPVSYDAGQGSNQHPADSGYHETESPEIVNVMPEHSERNADELEAVVGENDTTRQPHAAVDFSESSTDNQSHQKHDNNSDNFLEFVRDDEHIEDKQSTSRTSPSSQADSSNAAISSDIDSPIAAPSDIPDNEDRLDADDSTQIPLEEPTHQYQPSDVSASQSESAAPSLNIALPSNSTVASPVENQHSTSSLQSPPSLSDDMSAVLRQKIEDMYAMIASLREAISSRSDSDSEWLTRLSSIEKLLETSDSSKQNGYDEGYKAGYQAAMENGSDEIKNVIHKIRKISGELLSRKKEIIDESQDTIIELILLIAKKVVKQISKENKNIVVSNVKDALLKVKNHSNITIRINPSDLVTNEKVLKTISDEMASDSEIEFVEDTTIDNGGVCIETESSVVNAQISAQLLEIENSIRDMR